jgi:hypothetical protein
MPGPSITGENGENMEASISGNLLLVREEVSKEVELTVVREGDGKVSLNCKSFCLVLDAEALREALGDA